MGRTLRQQADTIVSAAIGAVLPDAAVVRVLTGQAFPGRIILVAAGKAAWQMATAAKDCLGSRIEKGIVITKYDHVKGPIGNLICREAGHPVPDEHSFSATREALQQTGGLIITGPTGTNVNDVAVVLLDLPGGKPGTPLK